MTYASLNLETGNIFVILVTTPQDEIQELHLCYQAKGVKNSSRVPHFIRGRWRASVAQARMAVTLLRKFVFPAYDINPPPTDGMVQVDSQPLDRWLDYPFLSEDWTLLIDFKKTHRMVLLIID